MTIDEAIKLIQKDIDDENVAWDSSLGIAYKLSFEALKEVKKARAGDPALDGELLPGETEE